MKEYLAVVEEVDLEEFVAESEHDGVPCLQPLLDVDELLVGLELELFGRQFFHFLVEVHDESFEKEIFLLEVTVLRHGVGPVGLDVLLLQGRILDEEDVPVWRKEYCFASSQDIRV